MLTDEEKLEEESKLLEESLHLEVITKEEYEEAKQRIERKLKSLEKKSEKPETKAGKKTEEVRIKEIKQDEFKKLKTDVVAASTDTVYTHKAWIETEELLKGLKFLMAADHSGRFSRELGIYNEESGMAQRAAFIVDPDGVLRAADIVADDIGRNAKEIVRKLKALQFVREHPGKVCPASWEEGGETLEPGITKAGKVYKHYRG